ncbi:HTH-type transcriptional activator RhaS [Afipia felis]
MASIPLTRCQFLLPFADILDGIGAPTGPLLGKFRLPSSLAEKSSLYIPILPAINFAETAQRTQDIEDFGFLAAQHLHFSDLSEKTRVLIAHSPTLLVALQHACKWASLEDTILTLWLEHADDHVKFCSKLAGTNGLPHLEHSQWLQNMFSIYIVRQFTSASWMPATMAFEARYTPRQATQAHWPNTRFLSGQHASWIDVPISHLSLANRSSNVDSPPLDNDGTPSACEIIKSLRLMLPSYLDNRIPPLTDVAELAGVSTRSLQRKLGYAGLTYSDLVETARYERASKLLRDTDCKIIDIAFSSGYADPAHFTRAFRRISGVTPRQFREQSRL